LIASELIARVTVLGADKAIRDLAGVGAASDDVGSKLGKGLLIGSLIGVAALVGIGVASLKMAGDFQQGVNRLKTGGGDIQDSFQSLWNGIQKVANATGVLTGPLTNAMYLIVSSGQRGAQAMNTLSAAAQGAQIEMADVKDVTQILTTIQTNWGLSTHTAAQYMDGLVSAVSHGKITLEALSVAMSPILPMAHQLGIHFSDIAAAMSDMTNQGVDANRGAQALRFVMQSIIQPTKGAQKAMQEFGVNSETVAQTLKTSFPDALQIYITAAEKGGGTTKDFVDRLGLMVGGGTRAGQALWALAQSMGVWRTDIAAVNTALGDTAKNVAGWATVQGNLNIQIDRAKAGLETMLQNIGAKLIPVITPLIARFTDWAGSLSNLVGHTDFSGLSTAIQGVADKVGGLFDTLGKIAQFTINSQSWKDAATAIGGASQQVGIFIGKVGEAVNANDNLTTALKGTWNEMGTTVTQAANPIQDFFTILNQAADQLQHKAMSTKFAFLQLGEADNTILTTADAVNLLGQHVTFVSDSVTGATIDIAKFARTADLSGSSTVSLAQALQLVGKHAGDMLTVADDTKLLSMNIGNVRDMTTGLTTDLKTAVQGGSVMVQMYKDWLDVLKKGVLISWGDFQVQQFAKAEAAIKKTAPPLAELQAKLLNLNKPETISVNTSDLNKTQQQADATRKRLMNINTPETVSVNTSALTTTQQKADETFKRLVHINGPYEPIVNNASTINAGNTADQTRRKLMAINGPYEPIVNVSSVVNAGAAADNARRKLLALNGSSSWTAYANINQINNVTNVVSTISAGPGQRRAAGGMIDEPVVGYGLRTGQKWTFGENGPEMVTPMKGGGASGGSGTGGSSGSSGAPVHVHVHVAGREVAVAVLPDIVSAIRNSVGTINV
jgi:TP901 family phage tail tape measure protein